MRDQGLRETEVHKGVANIRLAHSDRGTVIVGVFDGGIMWVGTTSVSAVDRFLHGFCSGSYRGCKIQIPKHETFCGIEQQSYTLFIRCCRVSTGISSGRSVRESAHPRRRGPRRRTRRPRAQPGVQPARGAAPPAAAT